MKYCHLWSEKRSLINVEAHQRQYLDYREVLGTTHTTSFIFARDMVAEELQLCSDNDNWKRLSSFFLNEESAAAFFQQGKKLRSEFALFLQKLGKPLTQNTNREIISLFKESCSFHSRFRAVFKVTRGEFLTAAEQELRRMVKDQKEFQILTTPSVMDEVNQEFIDWMELLKQGGDVPEHLHKYPWLVAHTYDQKKISDFMAARREKDRGEMGALESELRKLQEQKQQLRKQQEKLLQKYQNARVEYLSALFQRMAVERMRLKGGWSGSDYLYYPLYSEIAERTGIALPQLYSVYRIQEVVGALESKEKVSPQELENRRKAYVLRMRDRKIEFFSGDKALAIIAKEMPVLDDKEVVRGKGASIGKARGTVRVIIPGNLEMLQQGMALFQQGEILVTTMTQPNMVPLMKKASAIVTDEGGLTSHAAIISREFKLPCVVGTHVVTKILKEGDIVEVDGSKGEVKIIQKRS